MSVYGAVMIIEAVIIAILLIMWLRCRTKLIDAEFDTVKQRIKYSKYIVNIYDDIKNYLDTDSSFNDIHEILKDRLNIDDDKIISEVDLTIIKEVLHTCDLHTRLHISKLFSDMVSEIRESGDEDGK